MCTARWGLCQSAEPHTPRNYPHINEFLLIWSYFLAPLIKPLKSHEPVLLTLGIKSVSSLIGHSAPPAGLVWPLSLVMARQPGRRWGGSWGEQRDPRMPSGTQASRACRGTRWPLSLQARVEGPHCPCPPLNIGTPPINRPALQSWETLCLPGFQVLQPSQSEQSLFPGSPLGKLCAFGLLLCAEDCPRPACHSDEVPLACQVASEPVPRLTFPPVLSAPLRCRPC